MANNSYSVVTEFRRKSLCEITSGKITSVAPISYIAFGNGGCNIDGTVKKPDSKQTALNNEIGRFTVDAPFYPSAATVRYTVTIPNNELVGEIISEAALVDSDGNICAICNMLPKGKDEEVTFTFTFDDEF